VVGVAVGVAVAIAVALGLAVAVTAVVAVAVAGAPAPSSSPPQATKPMARENMRATAARLRIISDHPFFRLHFLSSRPDSGWLQCKGGKNSYDKFGIIINHAVTSPEPGTLPNSSPIQLKGGNITLR
jgi:hypothetical protein